MFLLLFGYGCNESYLEEQNIVNSLSDEKPVQLSELLNQFDPESGIIFVKNDGSIQEAINVCKSGDVIYIEPGIYKEVLNINKPDLKLIGLVSSADEPVILDNPGNEKKAIQLSGVDEVEISNIQIRNFKDNSTSSSKHKAMKHRKSSPLKNMEREDLGNGIAHYTFEMKLGNGEFDVVRIHRVVRESRPYHPVKTKSDIFMVHGSIQDFDDIFLTAGAENINAKTSMPFYLATKNTDVWGIDLGWNLVPADITDFSFMKDWGVDRDAFHTMMAMSVARIVRCMSGQGLKKLNLLGFSYGLVVAYDAAGIETQMHPLFRNIKGLVTVDHVMKYAPEDEEFRLNACKDATEIKELMDNGIYQYDAGQTFIFLGSMAMNAPDDPSPIPDFAGLTNKQVMLLLGSMTFVSGNPNAPFWHFVGGDLDDLFYTDFDRWLNLAVELAAYQPQYQLYEGAVCACDEEDVGIDDHLGEIKVPIFYLGTEGGMGTLGEYTTSLTASTDVTHYTVSVNENRMVDYGHADIFMGRDADELVWDKLYSWLIDHARDVRW